MDQQPSTVSTHHMHQQTRSFPKVSGITPQQTAEFQRYNRHNYPGIRAKRKPNILKLVVLSALGVLLLYTTLLATSAFSIYKSIDGATNELTALKQQILDGDYASVWQTSTSLAQRTTNLKKQTSNPIWAIASLLPVIGNDVTTLRAASDAAHILCDQVLLPMVGRLETSGTGSIIRDNNSINADTAQIMLEAISEAAPEIGHQNATIRNLKKCSFDQVDSARKQLRNAFNALTILADASPQLAERIHWLLGAEGETRTYLLIAQNNAELRSTGGLPGSFGPLFVDNGSLTLGEFKSLSAIPRYSRHYEDNTKAEINGGAAISPEEELLFGKRTGLIANDTNMIPNFSRAAQLFSWMYTDRGLGYTDGVIAIDPVFLQELLGVTGGFLTTDNVHVDEYNAALLLLHQIYNERDPAAQNAFFADVASQCFNALTSNLRDLDLVDTLQVFWHAEHDRRLQMFFYDETSQTAIRKLGYSGELETNPLNPVLGVYLCDDTWSKMSWYISSKTQIGRKQTNDDGSVSYAVKTTLTNHITQAQAESDAQYITGKNKRRRVIGEMVVWIYLVAPAEGRIDNVCESGYFTPPEKMTSSYYGTVTEAQMMHASYEGYDTWYGETQIAPGESTVVEYTVTTAAPAEGKNLSPIELDTTPTAQEVAGW